MNNMANIHDINLYLISADNRIIVHYQFPMFYYRPLPLARVLMANNIYPIISNEIRQNITALTYRKLISQNLYKKSDGRNVLSRPHDNTKIVIRTSTFSIPEGYIEDHQNYDVNNPINGIGAIQHVRRIYRLIEEESEPEPEIEEEKKLFPDDEDKQQYYDTFRAEVEECGSGAVINYFRERNFNIQDERLIFQDLEKRHIINRSLRGGDNKNIINSYEDDQIFIPSAGMCFFKIMKHNFEEITDQNIAKYVYENKVIVNAFPRCKINKFAKEFNIKINFYNGDCEGLINKLIKDYTNSNANEITISLYKQHYFQLKTQPYTQSYQAGKNYIDNIDRQSEVTYSLKEYLNEKEIKIKEDKIQHKGSINCSILSADIEASSILSKKHVPYAIGFYNVAKFMREYDLKRLDKTRSNLQKNIFLGPNCIDDFIDAVNVWVDENYKPRPDQTKTYNNTIKIYLHNGSKYDTPVIFANTTKKFTKWGVYKGKFKAQWRHDTELNLNRICLCDTLDYISGSLKLNCVSFNVPKELQKKKCDICQINMENYKEKLSE